MSEAIYRAESDTLDYTPVAAISAGKIVRMPDGRAGVLATDLAASEKGASYTEKVFDVICAAATVWSDGEEVFWDDTNKLAVVAGNANASFRLGVCVGGKSSTSLTTVRVDLNAVSGIAAKTVIVADSSAVSNTVTETVVATASFPASALKQGNVIAFLAALIATATNSTDTFRGRVRLGGVAGTVVADTGAIDLADNDVGVLRGEITIREDGASGTFVAASQSVLKTTAKPIVVQSTAIDTTAAITLVLTIEESVASASNSAKATQFNVNVK